MCDIKNIIGVPIVGAYLKIEYVTENCKLKVIKQNDKESFGIQINISLMIE